MTILEPTAANAPAPRSRGDACAWWTQGLRTAWLLQPDWRGLQVSPALLAWLLLVPVLAAVALGRLTVDGEAIFHAPALLYGWTEPVVLAWASAWLWSRRGHAAAPRDATDAAQGELLTMQPEPAAGAVVPGALPMFAMLQAQTLAVVVLTHLPWVLVVHGLDAGAPWMPRLGWTLFVVCAVWVFACRWRLLLRIPGVPLGARVAVGLLLAAQVALPVVVDSPPYWYAAGTAAQEGEAGGPVAMQLTQEITESQPVLLRDSLDALAPPQPDRVNVYALTFAPYAAEDVFLRESALVAQLMERRFGAQGRTLQLVNHASTPMVLPWATPENLRRAIAHIAQRMDRGRDILFIHLTSHGARDGQLAAAHDPLQVQALTPAQLAGWLAESGIRYRILSISACYSGSWIAPLADPGTLVMTAADADHTSYGCGRGSELTFFGRAMYAEELERTWSFERAHAAAREVIDRREREAGKADGYSNPQIAMGEAMRAQLAVLEAQRAAGR